MSSPLNGNSATIPSQLVELNEAFLVLRRYAFDLRMKHQLDVLVELSCLQSMGINLALIHFRPLFKCPNRLIHGIENILYCACI